MTDKRPAPRLAQLQEESLTPDQRKMMEAFRAHRKHAKLIGPFFVWAHAPELGEAIQPFSNHCRSKLGLPDRLRELVFLHASQHWAAQFVWSFHDWMAKEAGVSARTVEDVRAGRELSAAPEDERAVYALLRELYQNKRVSDATYSRVRDCIGEKGVIELLAMAGYASLVSMTLNTFQIMPEGELPLAEPDAA